VIAFLGRLRSHRYVMKLDMVRCFPSVAWDRVLALLVQHATAQSARQDNRSQRLARPKGFGPGSGYFGSVSQPGPDVYAWASPEGA